MRMPSVAKSHHDHPEIRFGLIVHLQRLLGAQTIHTLIRCECAVQRAEEEREQRKLAHAQAIDDRHR